MSRVNARTNSIFRVGQAKKMQSAGVGEKLLPIFHMGQECTTFLAGGPLEHHEGDAMATMQGKGRQNESKNIRVSILPL